MKGFATKPKVIGRQNQVDKSKIDASIQEQKAYEFLVRNQEAKEWIEDMIGQKLPPGTANFADHLRDGVVLCELANSFCPGSVAKIHKPRIGSVLEFMATDNINQFFRACEKIKFPSIYMFSVPDLWEKKNVYKIVHCIHTLADFVVNKGIKDVKIKKLKNAGLVFDAKEIEASKNLISQLEKESGPISMSFHDDDDDEEVAAPPPETPEEDDQYAQNLDPPQEEDELADPDHCVIVKGEIKRVKAGESCTFTLLARDADGNDIKKGGEKFAAELKLEEDQNQLVQVPYQDLDDGHYEFTYKVEKAGKYLLDVSLVDQVDEEEAPELLGVKDLVGIEVIVDPADPVANKCKVEGKGLESGVAGVSSEFKVEAFDNFGNKVVNEADLEGKLKVSLKHKSKADIQLEATVQVVNSEYQVTYNCPVSGEYEVEVLLNGERVIDPPTVVLIKDAGVSDPKKTISKLTSEPTIVAGQNIGLEIVAHDKHGNVRSSGGEKFVAELVDKSTGQVVSDAALNLVDANNGHYDLTHTIEKSGEYQVRVSLNGETVHIHDVTVADFGVTEPSKCVSRLVTAADSQLVQDLNSLRAGAAHLILVEARDKFGNLRAKLNDNERLVLVAVSKSKKEQVLQAEVNASGTRENGAYVLPFELRESDDYAIEVLLQDTGSEQATALPNYPSEIHLIESGKADASRCKFKGDYEKTKGNEKGMLYDGFTRALCQQVSTFTIAAYDQFGNARKSGGDAFHVELFNAKRNANVTAEVTDLGDGSYEVTYIPPTSGNYQIKVTLSGELVVNEQLPRDGQTLFVEPPPVKDIKPDIDAIDDHDLLSSLMNSFVVEQDNENLIEEIQRLREAIIKQIRTNTQVETEVKELDRKIQLLASNHAKAEELLQSSRGFFSFLLGGNRPKANQSGNANDTPLKDPKKLDLYSKMFYLLQVSPKYLSQCLYLVPAEKVDKFLETVILTLYGYAYSPREEFLMLNLFKMTLELEISKSKKLGSFLNNNPVLPKMVMTYGRRVQGKNFLQKILFDKILNNILGDKELNLELNAVKLLKDHIAKQEVNTGVKSTVNLRDLTYEKAMEHDVVAQQVKERVDKLTELCQAVLDGIIANVAEIPYGLRWVCKQLEMLLKQKHPESSEAERASVIGYIVYYRFMNPAIVSPDFFGLTKKNQKISMNMRNNLVILSKVLTNLTNNVLFDPKIEAQMTVMNDWLKKNQKVYVEQFIRALVQVGEPEETLGVHQYMELSLKKTPSITITWNEIFSTHALLLKYSAKLCAPSSAQEGPDPLKGILDTLGNDIPEELAADKNEELALPLIPIVSKDVEKAQQVTPEQLYDQTKHNFRSVLKSIPIDSLGENLLDTIANAKKIHAGQANEKSTLIMQKITAIEEAIPTLEAAELIAKSNCYRKLLLDITDEIQNQKVIRQKQQKELERLKDSLKSLEEHYKYLKDRIVQFKEYIEDNIRKQFKGSATSNQAQQVSSRKKKYTFKQLKDKGVIEELSVMQSQASKISFVISMTQPGQFSVEAKLLGMTVKTLNVSLDDLLDRQSKNISTIQYDNVVLNVNLTLHMLNKNFAAKN